MIAPGDATSRNASRFIATNALPVRLFRGPDQGGHCSSPTARFLGYRSAGLRYMASRNSTQGITMTTVAQLYQPARPIEVGNRQLMRRSAWFGSVSHRSAPLRKTTFPSLVGSFESRLGVGNRQPLRHRARQCITALRASRQLISTNTKLSSNRIRAVIGGLVLPTAASCRRATRRSEPRRVAPQLISTNYATQRRRPSGRVRWVSHQAGPVRQLASQRLATLHRASHLNGRPSGRHPQAFRQECFGMPSLASTT